MKRVLCFLLSFSLVWALVSWGGPVTVKAEENEDYELICDFYATLNEKDYGARVGMTVGDYHDTLAGIVGNPYYVQNRVGLYNVVSVDEVNILGEIPATEYWDLSQYASEISENPRAYLVQSYTTAYENTSFYFTGERFDVIFVGSIAGERKIISMNTALDSTVRNYMENVLGISLYGNSTGMCIPDVIVVRLSNGKNVEVDFKEYCQKVACSEVGYDSYDTDYHKASCIALKCYAMYRVYIEPADGGYHINSTTNDQIYDPDIDCSSWPRLLAALDSTWSTVLTDSSGNIFKSGYRSGNKPEHQEYNYQSSGIMLQNNAISQANAGWTFQQILAYAYSYSDKTGGTELKYVLLSEHVYEWQSDGSYRCSVCGRYGNISLGR